MLFSVWIVHGCQWSHLHLTWSELVQEQNIYCQLYFYPLPPILKQALRSSCELLREILIFKELHANSWNCLQAYETAHKHVKLHARIWNCMQAYEPACKLMALHGSCKLRKLHARSCNCMQGRRTELHESLLNCMQAHETACKLMELHASFHNSW